MRNEARNPNRTEGSKTMGPFPGVVTERKLGGMVRRFKAIQVQGIWTLYDRASGCTVDDSETAEEAHGKADLMEQAIGKCPKARNSIHQVDITKDPTDPTPACIMCGKAIDAEALELVGLEG